MNESRINRGGILIQEILTYKILNNTIESYLWFLGTFVFATLVILFLKSVLLKRIFGWVLKRSTVEDTVFIPAVRKYLPRFLYIAALYVSSRILTITDKVNHVLGLFLLAFAVYYSAKLLSAFIEYLFNRYREKKTVDSSQNMAIVWLIKMSKFVVWTIALLLLISNIVPDVSALIAGLGVGGIAIAFASQAIIEDIFSYFTIFFDRPYELGDFVIVGDFLGTVEHIGIRTTRLRSLGGEQLVFSNKDLTSARLKNFKTMQERRVVFSLGVTYDTPLETLKQLPDVIKATIEAREQTRFDRAHFQSYGDSSLRFEVVYYVLTGDYNIFMDIQQAINFDIREKFDALGVAFAFPSRTLYIENNTPKTTVINKPVPAPSGENI
ncbi:MAG: hypothetical protein BGO41_00515 [Clostridiales bacterium 38-18]|nr:MAG: hypothetical protein BGO41_00515 [Clostridiales bacterium 38-18]